MYLSMYISLVSVKHCEPLVRKNYSLPLREPGVFSSTHVCELCHQVYCDSHTNQICGCEGLEADQVGYENDS